MELVAVPRSPPPAVDCRSVHAFPGALVRRVSRDVFLPPRLPPAGGLVWTYTMVTDVTGIDVGSLECSGVCLHPDKRPNSNPPHLRPHGRGLCAHRHPTDRPGRAPGADSDRHGSYRLLLGKPLLLSGVPPKPARVAFAASPLSSRTRALGGIRHVRSDPDA